MDQDDNLLDALLLTENPETDINNKTFAAAAEFLGQAKAWLPHSGDKPEEDWIPNPVDAVITKGTTGTRTLCRDESIPPAPFAGNWYITVTGGASPGRANDMRRLNN